MSWFLVRIYLTAFVCATVVRTEVAIENGGYIDVLVSFAQNVPSNISQTLLENLEVHLEETSDLLRYAIGLRISKVTFLIPETWDTSEWDTTKEITSPTLQRGTRPDIVINGVSDNVFGKFPSAVQYGQCGTPGRQIVIPTDFLTDPTMFPNGTALAREWLKYRYGVFDENGYPGDELYPLFYTIPGTDESDRIVTDCSNEIITYNIIDKDGNNCSEEIEKTECKTDPVEDSLENITSSLMYFHEKIPHMQHVCGKEPGHNHNSLSRNKHNALCRGLSVWDVLNRTEDFRGFSTFWYASEGDEKIEFHYVKETEPKIVIAWENTHHLEVLGSTVVTAIKKVVYDLPNDHKIALIPYTNSIDKDYALRQLNSWPDWNTDTVSTFSKPVEGCVRCALTKALDALASDASTDSKATIIIVASSTITADDNLRKRLADSKACLTFFLFLDEDTPTAYHDYIEASPCGTLQKFNRSEKRVTVFEEMFSVMSSVLPETTDDTFTETVQTVDLPPLSNSSFDIDSTVQKVIFWIFPSKEQDAIVVTLNNEVVTLTKEQTADDVLALSFSPNSDENGTVQIINLYGGEILTQIRTTSNPGQYFTGEVFIEDTTAEGSVIQMPVILYARIHFGAYPVQNAEVLATVSRPDAEDVELVMYDDGRGNPDITAKDGIYSRYFTEFSKVGAYTVSVQVTNSELTLGGKHNMEGYYTCCGSSLNDGTLKLGNFTKTFGTKFIAISGRPEDGYEPSRIMDLRIDSVEDNKVVLTWTAPGGEADNGIATKYKMKLFCDDEENATDCDMHKMVKVLQCPPPEPYGTKQKVTIQILDNLQNIFIGIVTLNEKDKESDLSNIVQITGFSPSILEITTPHPDPSNKRYEASHIGTIIGSSIAGILILICITIVLIFFYSHKAKDKKTKENNPDKNITNIEPKTKNERPNHGRTAPPMRRVESFPVLLYTHDQIKDFRDKEKDPPLYRADVPPKPWMSLNVLSGVKSRGNSEDEGKSSGSLSTLPANGFSEINLKE